MRKEVVKDFMLYLFVILLIGAFRGFFVDHYNLDFDVQKPTGKIATILAKTNGFINLLILIPVIEEVTFRLYLKPIRKNILISLTLISIVFADWLLGACVISNISYYLIMILLIVIVVFLLEKYCDRIIEFAKCNQRLYLSISVFIFVVFHLKNEYSSMMLMWSPILLLPQIAGGVFLAHLRIKYTIFHSMLFHSIYNGILIIGYNIMMVFI